MNAVKKRARRLALQMETKKEGSDETNAQILRQGIREVDFCGMARISILKKDKIPKNFK